MAFADRPEAGKDDWFVNACQAETGLRALSAFPPDPETEAD